MPDFTLVPKPKTYRSERWLQAVREIAFCVLCGAHGVQAAHRNQGKGTSVKADDCLSAALCVPCHEELDNGKKYTRAERRALMDDAVCRTLVVLVITGKVTIA